MPIEEWIMNRQKLLTIVALGLLVVNLGLVGFLLLRKPPHQPLGGGVHAGKHAGPRDIIIERLNFDSTQITAYDDLIREHRIGIRNAEREMREYKSELYQLLAHENQAETSAEKFDSLICVIGDVQKRIEKINYEHFADIKTLCRPDQLPRFAELTSEIAVLFSHRRHPKEKGRNHDGDGRPDRNDEPDGETESGKIR